MGAVYPGRCIVNEVPAATTKQRLDLLVGLASTAWNNWLKANSGLPRQVLIQAVAAMRAVSADGCFSLMMAVSA